MSWASVVAGLAERLQIFAGSDPRLLEVQRRRALVYLADGAVKPNHLTDDGRYVMPEDADALHFALGTPATGVTGGIWWRMSERPDCAWGGGWWTSEASRPVDGALLILILMAQSLRADCRYGWTTVTHRHRANHLLRKLGAEPIWEWDDVNYNCAIEWMQFNLTDIPERYRAPVRQLVALLKTLTEGPNV